jgi:hypothetical protein
MDFRASLSADAERTYRQRSDARDVTMPSASLAKNFHLTSFASRRSVPQFTSPPLAHQGCSQCSSTNGATRGIDGFGAKPASSASHEVGLPLRRRAVAALTRRLSPNFQTTMPMLFALSARLAEIPEPGNMSPPIGGLVRRHRWKPSWAAVTARSKSMALGPGDAAESLGRRRISHLHGASGRRVVPFAAVIEPPPDLRDCPQRVRFRHGLFGPLG